MSATETDAPLLKRLNAQGEMIERLTREIDRVQKRLNTPQGGWIRTTIVVPLYDQNTGECRPEVHAKVQEGLRKLGGGESHVEGAGSYVMDDATIADDEGLTYSVLLTAWNMNEDYTMRGLARYVGREMHQESVLVTWERIDGGVMFVRPDSIDNID